MPNPPEPPRLSELYKTEAAERKTRRWSSILDEEIEEDVECLLPYWAAWPKGYRLPYPVDTRIIPNTQQYGINSKLLHEKIVPILRRQLSHYTVDHECLLCWRASRDMNAEDISKRPITLLVRTGLTKIPRDAAIRAVISIRKILAQDTSTLGVLVEVTDYYTENNMFTFPIGINNNELMQDVETACQTAIKIIQGHE